MTMTLTTYLAACAGLLLAYYLGTAFLAWRRLRSFRGPFSANFSYLFMARTALGGSMWSVYRDVSATYGSVARIGPNELLTDDPQLIRRLSSTRAGYKRSSWYEPNRLDPYEHSMFSLRDNVAHDRLKGMTASGYSGREVPGLEAAVDAVLAQFVETIRTKYCAPAGQLVPMDFATLTSYFTLDSITEISFGQQFGFLTKEEDLYAYAKSILEVAPIMQMCSEIPELNSLMSSALVLKLAGPKLTDEKGIGKLMAVARDLVSQRFGPDAKDRQDMLGAFVRNGLTRREAETEALFQILAGSDTTAGAIRSTFLHVITSPLVYRTLQLEIDDANISSPITNDEALGLPYLQAVILEGLRIHPPFVGLPFKEVPSQGDTIHGHFVPAGTRITPSLWSLTRRQEIFGQDAELFRPERWLDADSEKRDDMRRTLDLIFGYGRWACAGKSIAFLELNKVFVELLRNFDFQLIYPRQPYTAVNHNLFLMKDMWVKASER